jgi:hypothetical protein
VNDLLVLLISVIVSGIAALSVLWYSNPGFGSWLDYANTFVWGFGVSQLTGQAAAQATPAEFYLPGKGLSTYK